MKKCSKYTGLGNDFIVCLYEEKEDYSTFAKEVCNRYLSIGADGLLVLKNTQNLQEMIFYNADGSRAPMCGNGLRCFVNYLYDEGYINDINNINVQTLSGTRKAVIKSINPFIVTVNMGKAIYDRSSIDIDGEGVFLDEIIPYKDKEIIVSAVFMTTHHLVVIVEDLEEVIKTDLGEFLCKNKVFNKGINVNFVQIIDKDTCYMKTYERGVGWTLACGSGACSVFAVLNRKDLCNNNLKVLLTYGELNITKDNDDIIMSGSSKKVADVFLTK